MNLWEISEIPDRLVLLVGHGLWWFLAACFSSVWSAILFILVLTVIVFHQTVELVLYRAAARFWSWRDSQ